MATEFNESTEKEDLRTAFLQKRAALSLDEKKILDEKITARLTGLSVFRGASALLLYVPVRGEIDILPLVRAAREAGIRVAFPVCREESRMEFRILEPGAKMVAGKYGIPVPPEGAPLCLPDRRTLCVVPGLAFDRSGYRIGYGKGYYDRFLAGFPGVSVGLSYEKWLLPTLPRGEHDLPATCVVTENGVIVPTETGTPAERNAGTGKEETPADASPLWERMTKPLCETAERLRKWAAQKFLSRKDQNESKDDALPVLAPDARAEQKERPILPLHAPAVLVAILFLLLFLSRYPDAELTRRGLSDLSVLLLQLLLFPLPAAIYLILRGEDLPSRLRIRPIRPEQLWFCLCMLIVMISGSLLANILTGGIASLGGNFTLYDTFVARINGRFSGVAFAVIAYGILPAIGEELLFRAILCAEYERYGVGISVFVSTVFFAMSHFSFPLLLNYLLLGTLLAVTLYATRSLLAPILLHLFYNLFCLFGQPYLSTFYVTAGSNEIFVFCLIVLFLLFSAFCAGETRKFYHRYARRGVPSDYTEPVTLRNYPRRLFRALLSPAVGVCLVFWLLFSILEAVG